MEARKVGTRSKWSKPALVRKPVRETMQGNGANTDNQGGEMPVGS